MSDQKKRVSRREFVKVAAVGVTAAGLGTIASAEAVAQQTPEKCPLVYNTGTNTVSCKGDECPPVYKMVDKVCTKVTPQCRLLSKVRFQRGRFVTQGAAECFCFVEGSKEHCELVTETAKNQITSAKCVGDCDDYYRDDKCKVKITDVKCEMVIDHTGGNIIRCLCILPQKP